MTGAKIGFLAFLRDRQGNVLPMAAVGMLISAALVGGGIDMSRAYRGDNRLQAACDAGVLAGRRSVGSNGFDAHAQSQALSYFKANFDDTTLETNTTVFTPSSDDNGQTVKGTATTRLNLAVMKIFGFPRFNLEVSCQASMGMGNSDVVMVLDTTGSMAGSRITALRAAMKNFYVTVANATTGSNARIRYGFVPYSQTVNVGALLYNLSPTYLVNTHPIQSRVPVYTTSRGQTTFSGWDYRSVSYDVSRYKAGETVVTNTGNEGAAVSSTWGGCIEERETVATDAISYSTTTGMTPSNAYDLDLDLIPTTRATRWRPMWPEVAFLRNGNHPYSVCPRAARLLAPMSQADFDAYADSLTTNGSTYLDIGLVWGGRLISPDGIFKANVTELPANGGEVARHVIFMSDGDMDTIPTNQSAWGVESLDMRVTGDGTETREEARHTLRFLALCSAIKAKGIRLWTIFFDTGTNADMTNCASANSAYNANNPTQLNTAFQEIAKQVGELRIIQ